MIGILFDFNGTMFFDESFQEESWKSFLMKKTGRAVTEKEFQKYIHGRNSDFSLPYFLGRPMSRDEIELLEEEKESIYRKLCLESESFQLADGLPAFLDELVARKVPITIATASGWNNVKFFFEHLDLDRWFDIDKVVYNDGALPGKPEPDLYLKAAKRLGVDIHSCIVFEDSVSGVESAKRAGALKTIGVASMRKNHLSNEIVSDIIHDYSNLALLLKMIGIESDEKELQHEI